MRHQAIHPASLGAPKGYSHGILAARGRTLFVAGMVGWEQGVFPAGFVAQFDQALKNVMAVVRAAGGDATDVCRLTVYVTDKRLYLESLKDVGAVYRASMGRHFPAMALVEVSALVEDAALVEIEATAVVAEEGP